MKNILIFVLSITIGITNAIAATRTENATNRAKTVSTQTSQTSQTSARSTRSISSRNALKTTVVPRAAKNVSVLTPRQVTQTTTYAATQPRSGVKNVMARATTTTTPDTTRTGAAYEQCKSAFFACMDQFCQLKNDNFRRCSCNDRVFDFQDISNTYQSANEKLSEFSENLDVVGMTAAQATAMKTASEGEDALTADKSASKQLLQAIMNSISGSGDTTVGGKYRDLNSVTISSDVSNAFGMDDSGQIIASYNGATLYKAVYPKCRNAVQADCNTASLQRAVNAYLMAIEQDCNTVQTALQKQQKTLQAATHESSALLDLARVENRRKHNADDVATCLTNVEKAILDEQVCGANYHKCLDYGQFIDANTGAPITGVSDFYKLGELLTFKTDTDIHDQKLSSIQNNKYFVQFFENKTKKFALDALDKCTEDSDFVWGEYLDRALLDIYYAQQNKVETIQQSCMDLVANCYDNQNLSIKNAMANLTGDSSILLKPAAISLSTQMCSKYIDSCNGMFNGNIIQTYIANKDSGDLTSACRGVAQQCFDKFGGTGYNNFYYTQSGLFTPGAALDWFSLYEKNDDNTTKIVSPCAQQVFDTPGCADKIDEIFGGFDKYTQNNTVVYSADSAADTTRQIRPVGIATEVYYKVLDDLQNNCNGLGGFFVEYKYAVGYGYRADNFCKIDSTNPDTVFYINEIASSPRSLNYWYHFIDQENICPANYTNNVDTQSWGMCSCWENGGRRSKNGKTATCRPLLPAIYDGASNEDVICTNDILCKVSYGEDEIIPELCANSRAATTDTKWCQQTQMSSLGQICPLPYIATEVNSKILCSDAEENGSEISTVSTQVPHH